MRGIIGVLFYSVIALAPILAGVSIASRFLLGRKRLIALAALAVVVGFLAGGVVGAVHGWVLVALIRNRREGRLGSLNSAQ